MPPLKNSEDMKGFGNTDNILASEPVCLSRQKTETDRPVQ